MAAEPVTAVRAPVVALGRHHRWDITARAVVVGILDLAYGQRRHELIRAVAGLVDDGADAVDIGAADASGEELGEAEELDRVLAAVDDLQARFDLPLVLATDRGSVASAAFGAGAAAVDGGCGSDDRSCLAEAAAAGASVVLTHDRPLPPVPADDSGHVGVVGAVISWLDERAGQAEAAGIPSERVIVDPGLDRGGKAWHQSLLLLRSCGDVADLGYPLLVAASNKAFLGRLLGLDVDERSHATVAANVCGIVGGGRLLRAHDVRRARRVADVMAALLGHG